MLHPLVCAGSSIVCIAGLALPCAGAAPPEPGYTYRGEWIPLKMDAERLALLRRPGPVPSSPVAGLAGAALAPAFGPGWVGATLAAPMSTERIRALAPALEDGTVAFVSPVLLDSRGLDTVVTPWMFVRFREDVSEAAAADRLRGAAPGFEIESTSYGGVARLYRLRCTSTSGFDVLDAANALAALPEVEFAEPDFLCTAVPHQVIPTDEHFFRFYYLHSTGQNIIADWNNVTPLPPSFEPLPDFDIDAPEAWDLEQGDPSVVAVVFDMGVQSGHPDINIDPDLGWSPIPSEPPGGDPLYECSNHGTPVGGIITGRMNNTIGGAGVAPSCRLASMRVLHPSPETGACTNSAQLSASWIIAALARCELFGARVTNHSYGFGPPSAALDAAFAQTREGGMVHFASVGNAGSPSISYPASSPAVNSVGSLDPSTGVRYFESNYGAGLDFTAPGFAIFTTDRTGADGYAPSTWGDPAHPDYVAMIGTSFASPIAAGVASLVISARPSLTAAEVERIMRETCRDIGAPGYDIEHGHGFVNAYRAVRRAIWPCPGDWNNDGEPNSTDICAFLTDWIASVSSGTVVGDVDENEAVNSSDISAFLTLWLSAVQGGC